MNMRGITGKWNAMALVAVAEVVDDVLGPLVRLREQHAVGVVRVDLGSDALEERVRRRGGSRSSSPPPRRGTDGIEAEPVEPEVEPEAKAVEHRLGDVRVLVVQVRLVVVEAMPEIGAADGSNVQFDCSESTKMMRASS